MKKEKKGGRKQGGRETWDWLTVTRGGWGEGKKERERKKGGLCLARRICDSLLSLQKMKSSVWHGACRQGDGSLQGEERAGGRGREREATQWHIQWCQCASWAARETTLPPLDGFLWGRSDGYQAHFGSSRPSLYFPGSSNAHIFTPAPYRLLSVYLSDQELGDGALGFSRRGNSPKTNLSPR